MIELMRQSALAAVFALGAGGVLAQQAPVTPPARDSAPAVQPEARPPASRSLDAQVQQQLNQPLNNAPMWREVRSGEEQYTSVKGREAGVLIQSGGETWRERRNYQIIPYGGIAIALALGLLALFYVWKGPIRLHEPPTGRVIERFSNVERWAHWGMAITFCALAISGLVMLFGKYVLLPIIGPTLFSTLTILLKNLHNFIGPLFTLSILIFFVIYVRDNIPSRDDLIWIKKAGGMASGEHVPTGRFNAGEKAWFWASVVVLGLIVSVTGFILNFDNFGQTRATMQQSHLIHAGFAVLFMAMSLAHIYIGTIGMQGAYQGMRTGYVDEEWAREHHELWYREVKAGEREGPAVPDVPLQVKTGV